MSRWFGCVLGIALSYFCLPIRAQQTEWPYPEITLAKYDDGTEMKAVLISYPKGLKSSTFTEGLPYLVMQDNEEVTRIYDLATLKTIAEVNPRQGTFFHATRDGYLTIKNSSFIKDDRVPTKYSFDHQKVWSSKYQIALSNVLDNVVVCYHMSLGKTWGDGHMVGYDLSTGRELWRTTIPQHRHSGLCNYLHEKGSPYYYMMADSLVRLNLLTGDTVRRAFEAGVKESLKSRFSIVKSRTFSSSAWRREAMHSYTPGDEGNVLTGTHSGWVVNGDTLFVADAGHVYAYDRDLYPLWQTALPEGVGGFSQLREDGGRLMLMGFGEAFQNGVIGRCGQPFTAYYDKATGRQLAFQLVGMKEKVTGGCIVPGRTYWECDNGFYYTDEGDTTATRIAWKPKTDREPMADHPDRVICDTVGILRNDKLEFITTYRNELLVELYGKDVYRVQADGTAYMLKAEEVYFHDMDNLYSTNAEPLRHYVLIDPVTHEVKKGFNTTGNVTVNKAGDLFIQLKNGLGIVRNLDPNENKE